MILNRLSKTLVVATRSSKFGLKMVRIKNGKYHAIYNPPWNGWISCAPIKIAAEQLNSTPRFF